MNNQKDLLAKLLATENVEVVHKPTQTASFNVVDRILTLPLWDDMQSYTYDHLVGHEVGHALFTPVEGWHESVSEKGTGYKSFLNVIEDARIEKLIQRRYPGLRREFIRSYKKMLAEGFFGADADSINNYDLIDRINVHFKCGISAGVKFDQSELVWVKEIEECETWEQVVDIADRLYTKAKEELEEKQQELGNESADDGGEEFPMDMDFDSEEGESSDQIENNDSTNNSSLDYEESDVDDGEEINVDQPADPTSQTDEDLRDNISKEYSDSNATEIHNIYITEKSAVNRIVSYKKVLKDSAVLGEFIPPRWYSENDNREEQGDELYTKFLANNKKTINYLVKEFEMKKSADAYSRATVSKTGVIDPVLMNSYKYNDDIFRKVTNVPEGKNHGMIMYLDWSGSMHHDLKATVEQTLNLVHFCRQVNIPFRVYAFTDRFVGNGYDLKGEFKVGEAYAPESVRLIEFFNNKMNRQQFARMTKVLLLMGSHSDAISPMHYRLGGTPLNDTIAFAHKVEELFQKVNKVDIVNTIFLTDGDSHPLNCVSKYESEEGDYFRSSDKSYWYKTERVYIHDTVTKKRIRVNRNGMTKALLKAYRDRTGSNVIGFRIMPVGKSSALREFEYLVNSYTESYKLYETLKKEKYVNISGCGYDKFFGIKGGKHLETANGSFQVADDAKKGAILSAFRKANTSKIVSRSLLNEFIKEVA